MIATLLLTLLLGAPQGPPPPPPPPRPPGSDQPIPKGTSSISGRVTSADTGRPLRRAQVRVTAPGLPQARTASTDIEGAYELTELPAGRYTIAVSRSGHLPALHGQRRHGEPGSPLEVADGDRHDRIDFTLQRAGIIAGRITDETGEPASGVQVFALQAQYFRGRRRLVPSGPAARTDDTGFYRLLSVAPGEYVVSGTLRETWVSDEDPKAMLAFAPSYYPGTTNPADAQRVAVRPGQEIGSVDFYLVPSRAATISGTALGSDGSPLSGAIVSLTQEITGPSLGAMSMVGNTRAAPDGSWRLPNLPPGEYTLRVSSQNRERPESATATVTVQGADVEGIVLAADGGAIVAGEVVVEGGGPLPSSTSPLRVTTQPLVEEMSRSIDVGADDGVVGPEGRFSWRSRSGPMLLRIAPLPAGWAVKSVEIGGREHAESPIEVRGGRRIDGVRVTLTNRFPSISGRITDEKGNPAQGTVVLFPDDERKWAEPAGSIRHTRPDQAGVYRLDTVRPGEYLIVALDAVQQWQIFDPEFLEALRSAATRVTLGDSGAETLNLRIRK